MLTAVWNNNNISFAKLINILILVRKEASGTNATNSTKPKTTTTTQTIV